MDYNFVIYNQEDLEFATQCKAKEVTIPIEGMCKEGGISQDDALELSSRALQQGLNVYFCCDQLVEERNFSSFISHCENLLGQPLIISDIGVAKWLKDSGQTFSFKPRSRFC